MVEKQKSCLIVDAPPFSPIKDLLCSSHALEQSLLAPQLEAVSRASAPAVAPVSAEEASNLHVPSSLVVDCAVVVPAQGLCTSEEHEDGLTSPGPAIRLLMVRPS